MDHDENKNTHVTAIFFSPSATINLPASRPARRHRTLPLAPANLHERHAALCQSLYFRLREMTLFSLFRSNFFSSYKNYAAIINHAKNNPDSRTAICLELTLAITQFVNTRTRHRPHKISLSQNVHQILVSNKKFFQFLNQQYPDFINAFTRQRLQTVYGHHGLYMQPQPASPEERKVSRNLTNTIEGNPFIHNIHL